MNQPRPLKPTPRIGEHGGHGGHAWMMVACCIPMLILAIGLVATGVVNAGFLFFAVGCMVMMALMMRMMMPNNDRQRARREPPE